MANDDMELVRQFVTSQSESAFAALVSRYTNLVYSAAFRRMGNSQLAEEITQAVFTVLAQKAGTLDKKSVLPGWLYRVACYVSGHAIKQELRRQRREQEAFMESLSNHNEPEIWSQITPLLEDAMMRLNQAERDALVLRFFEGHSLKEAGIALGTSEAAAKMRVIRALEKLRVYFSRHGVNSTSETIAGMMSANFVMVAPPTLAKMSTAVALAKGATASATTLTLIKGALKLMAWTKAQTTIVAGAVILLAAGTTAITVKKIDSYDSYRNSWLTPNLDSYMVEQSYPQVRILPTRFPMTSDLLGAPDYIKWAGLNQSVSTMMRVAYQWPPARMVFTAPEPRGRYDFIASLPHGSYEALQHELKKQFGLIGRVDSRDEDVLVLEVKTPNAPGLKPPVIGSQRDWSTTGQYICDDGPLSTDAPPFLGIQNFLEQYFNVPVVDETGLTNHFSIDLKWRERGQRDPNHKALKQALADQLGLELVPARRSIEMLVAEKAK